MMTAIRVAILALVCMSWAGTSHAQTDDRGSGGVEVSEGYVDGFRDGHLGGYAEGFADGRDLSAQALATCTAKTATLEEQVQALEAANRRLRAEIARLTGDRGGDDGDGGGGRGDDSGGRGDDGSGRGDDDDPPSTRGARLPLPANLIDKTGYGSGWGNDGDAVYLKTSHPLISGKGAGGVYEMAQLSGVRLRPGYRSGLMSTMGAQDRYRLAFSDSALVPASPNGPAQGWAGQGTLWGGRVYGVHSGTISNIHIEDWFGDSYADNEVTSREGHGFYFTLSQTPGALLTFEDLSFENLGGHALHFAAAYGDRAGNAPPPQAGGRIVIDQCSFVNTDRCQARGAYAVSMYHAHAAVTISNSIITQDQPVSKNGTFSGGLRSRGLVQAEGVQESLTIRNCLLRAAAPSDRSAQVWVEGPDFVLIEGSTLDCQAVSINDPYGDNAGTIKTRRLVFRNNAGDAIIKWNGQILGKASDVNGEWIQ